ncbi:MAG: hypothetical protein ACOCQB_01555 [Halanaerobiaceae bacterium]
MRLNYFKLSPAENTTVIITDPVLRERYAGIARKIMCHTHLAAEQVGFFTRVRDEGADYKLEMAGGEFCGNAVLAAGALAGFMGIKDNKLILAVSGANTKLKVNFAANGDKIWQVRSTMPVANEVKKSHLMKKSGYLVRLDGITHFLYEDESLLNYSRKGERKRQQKMVKELLSREKGQAAGVIPYIEVGTDYYIRPCVYVKETGSLVFEKSCGSGTLALGFALAGDFGKPVCCRVMQPGGVITIDTEIKAGKGGGTEVEKAWIAADVELTCCGSVYV